MWDTESSAEASGLEEMKMTNHWQKIAIMKGYNEAIDALRAHWEAGLLSEKEFRQARQSISHRR